MNTFLSAVDIAEAFNRAVQLQHAGRFAEAEPLYGQILAVDPGHAEAFHMLGLLAHQLGNPTKAIELVGRAVALRPDFIGAQSNLGNLYQEVGQLDESVACYWEALTREPTSAEIFSNLGAALYKQGKIDEAVMAYQQSVRLLPDYAEAYTNLAIALWSQGKLAEAATQCQKAIALKPNHVEAYSHMAVILKHQGRLEDAVACYREALRLRPYNIQAHSNLLFALHNCAGITAAALASVHEEFERLYTAPLRASWQPHANRRDPARKLRLGFVSADLASHPVGYFLIRLVDNSDPREAEIICYSNRAQLDDMSRRFQQGVFAWRDILPYNDAQLAELIRADEIDILFDLSGHTAGHRLLTFARKPAPIQISWAGYVGTTGLAAMDYVLADRFQAPPGAEQHYREQILRLPDDYICYDPPDYAPPVGPLPALSSGYVTFGSFNNQAKLTPQMIRLWADILRRVPHSRLLMKYRGMNDPTVAGRLSELFASAGIDGGRLEFLGSSPHADLLAAYNRVDIGLDPFPYSGGLTTCEALWMGVPVVTCPGETFASRHALSHLSNAGLTETIARDFNEYAAIATALANDLPRLTAIRARLRDQMAASPLCDGPRFARNLMQALRDVWRAYCGAAF